MVVATGILSMIIVAFAGIMNSSYKVFYYSQNELGSLGQAAAIMRDFEKTTRDAGANGTSFDNYSTSKLTFYAYQRGNAYPAPNKISYYFDNGSNILKKSVITPEGTSVPYSYPDANKKISAFAGNITNTDHNIFSYYSGNSDLLTGSIQPTAIRMIKIDVTVGGKVPASESTIVQLRSLKDNL